GLRLQPLAAGMNVRGSQEKKAVPIRTDSSRTRTFPTAPGHPDPKQIKHWAAGGEDWSER
ncbi:MAG: hypothetical protein RLZZ470_1533, partial [Pseudomonadota bacterium]